MKKEKAKIKRIKLQIFLNELENLKIKVSKKHILKQIRQLENSGLIMFSNKKLTKVIKKYLPRRQADIIACYGIVHHADGSPNVISFLIPISENAESYYFKYHKINNKESEHKLGYLKPILFRNDKIHSLSPNAIPDKKICIFVSIN